MKLGLVAGEFINNDTDHNINKIYSYLEVANKDNTDLIFFGEGFLQGFDALEWVFDKDKSIAIDIDHEIIKDIKRKVKETKVGLGVGYYEYFKDSIYCSYLVLDKMGNTLCNYRRISEGWKIPGLPFNYKEGNTIGEFNFESKSFKLAMCGDLWDDSILDKYNNLECDFSLWPLYVNFDLYDDIDNYIERVNESGNNIFIINSLSKDPVSQGGSYHIQNGELLNKPKINKESLLVIEV